jgi:hypothetical protein
VEYVGKQVSHPKTLLKRKTQARIIRELIRRRRPPPPAAAAGRHRPSDHFIPILIG